MLKLRSSWLRAAAGLFKPPPTSAAQSRVHLSSGPQQKDTTFYEFRTYCIRPEQNATFLKLTNEKIHLRTAHSELIGYWSVEYGGLNKVFHIWRYDSYSQRAAVRAALAQDPSWLAQYISMALPMLSSQDNEVTYLVPWTHLQKPPKEGGVYELVSFQMCPGGPAVWGKDFQAAISAHDAPGYGKVLGVFHNEFGPLNRVHALWWFESADRRAELRHKAHADPRVVAAVRNSSSHLVSQENRLMFPCHFSPLK
ncbi:protein NipSnap homolog 3A-like isoform X2 [Takifugu rubripes]|uniref:protein NipSnap homolog 3A-like isoform X2 n=1 Tax=Takifugu rubripes TaxID=31033 RepID=UPI001145DB77|nr:protein NipSnap homolog 3A-like isoform X2 [Takifugu rubripes]XP_029688054.1 protein NipSnap homolog 3A-like isoform X2 [Takifugu rubripes]